MQEGVAAKEASFVPPPVPAAELESPLVVSRTQPDDLALLIQGILKV